MERMNPGKEARVWQRVGEGPRSGREDLRPLMLAVQENEGVYRSLAARQTGHPRQRLLLLAANAQMSLSLLKGIQKLRGEAVSPLGQPQPSREPAARLLEICYRRCLTLVTEYMARTLDPEYGCLWQVLADRERKSCEELAQVLGSLGQ